MAPVRSASLTSHLAIGWRALFLPISSRIPMVRDWLEQANDLQVPRVGPELQNEIAVVDLHPL